MEQSSSHVQEFDNKKGTQVSVERIEPPVTLKDEQQRKCDRARTIEGETEPAHEFTLFPKLPAELRLMIWKAALPGPRVVRMPAGIMPGNRRKLDRLLIRDICNTVNRTCKKFKQFPCHEAQEVFERTYHKLVISTRFSNFSPYFFVDYTIDTVFMEIDIGSTHSRIHPVCPADKIFWNEILRSMQNIKHLAIGGTTEEWFEDSLQEVQDWFHWLIMPADCGKLHTLTYVHGEQHSHLSTFRNEWTFINISGDERKSPREFLASTLSARDEDYIEDRFIGCGEIGTLNLSLIEATWKIAAFERARSEVLELQSATGQRSSVAETSKHISAYT